MHARLRGKLTYANVVATLALFLVLGGGTALAAYVVNSNSDIGPGTVSGGKPPSGDHANIISGSLTSKDLAPGTIPDIRRIDFAPAGCVNVTDPGCTLAVFSGYGLTLTASCGVLGFEYMRVTADSTQAVSSLNWLEVTGPNSITKGQGGAFSGTEVFVAAAGDPPSEG